MSVRPDRRYVVASKNGNSISIMSGKNNLPTGPLTIEEAFQLQDFYSGRLRTKTGIYEIELREVKVK